MYNHTVIYLAPSILAEAKRLNYETNVGRRKTLRLGSIAEKSSVKPNILEVPEPEVPPLLEHLRKIAGENEEVQKVIQLLKDIRTYQGHPKMVGAFKKHDHALAHGAKDHGTDILDLLFDGYADYLKEKGIEDGEGEMDLQKMELEIYVKHAVINTLKGYQDVVADIRNEVSGIAEQLKNDQSIRHIRELVGSLQNKGDDEALREVLEDLDPAHPAHHIISGESDNAHHALAKAAVQQGHNSPEEVANYLNKELYPQLTKHFKGKIASGVFSRTPESAEEVPRAHLDESALHRVKENFTPRGSIYVVKKGNLTSFAYALSGSLILVESGAKLSIGTLGDDVTIKLKGDTAFVEIKRVTQDCKKLRILGGNRKSLTGGPNLELGEGVAEKLKTD